MTPPLNLAVIIDSWERLSTASMDDYSDQGRLNHLRLLARFRDQHFTTLLAVARAAVKMRAGAQRLLDYHDRCLMYSTHGTACAEGLAAFDAAAAGAAKGEG